jgi:hypothetical protein
MATTVSFISRSVLFGVCVLAGSSLLFIDIGNLWLRAGFAVLTYASAFRSLPTVALSRHGLSPYVVMRIWAIATTLAGSLGCIGSLSLGGAIGWLGVFLSLRFGLTGAWILWKMTNWPNDA